MEKSSPKNYWLKIILVKKWKNNLVKKKNLVKKIVLKKNWSKKRWTKKVFGLKQFWQKKFVSKTFGDFYKDFGSPLLEA